MAKAQMLHEAIERLDGELRCREEMNAGTPSQAELSRHALKLKLSSRTAQHPDPRRSAFEGMRNKERRKPPKMRTTKREIGRVS
jgi:hypothetical protein